MRQADAVWAKDVVPRLQAAKAERELRLVGREDVVASIEALLFELDPIGINFEDNTDEYRSEAQTIALRLPDAKSAEDLRRIVHEEFVRWFGGQTAGPEERYREIARAIWDSHGPRPQLGR